MSQSIETRGPGRTPAPPDYAPTTVAGETFISVEQILAEGNAQPRQGQPRGSYTPPPASPVQPGPAPRILRIAYSGKISAQISIAASAMVAGMPLGIVTWSFGPLPVIIAGGLLSLVGFIFLIISNHGVD